MQLRTLKTSTLSEGEAMRILIWLCEEEITRKPKRHRAAGESDLLDGHIGDQPAKFANRS